ncbi:GNAT family N-acetyltransferase [Actinoplanes sp. NPDC023936]|uniref:GNAT family N-acetyltransferase n=1 Tax=Actinoplanes sp. NPDC023936 TaxID=3154910 RepID=UPI0033DF1D17
MRREARPETPAARIERSGRVIRHVGGEGDWNAVIWSDLDESTADAAIAGQLAMGAGFEWKLYGHDRPADLADRLRTAGFVAEEPETLLVAAVGELRLQSRLPDGVRVEEVTDPAGVELMVGVSERAFGGSIPWLRPRLLAQVGSPTTLMLVAMAGDEPVCAARMDLHPGTAFASLWGGGTLAQWRGRGIYRALVAYRARRAAELGYEYLQVDATEQSRPILERLGFTALTTTTPFVLPG